LAGLLGLFGLLGLEGRTRNELWHDDEVRRDNIATPRRNAYVTLKTTSPA